MQSNESEQLLANKLKIAEIANLAMKDGVDVALQSLVAIHKEAKTLVGESPDGGANLISEAYLLGMEHMIGQLKREYDEYDWDESLISMKAEVVKQHDEKHPRGE